jgi:hypothetical protein
LCVCACARSAWDRLTDGLLREAVEAGERHADGRATDELLASLFAQVYAAEYPGGGYSNDPEHFPGNAALSCVTPPDRVSKAAPSAVAACWAAACRLLRCIFSYAAPPATEAAWLAWGGGAVGRLAEAAYEDRILPSGELDRARLAVLADALEDAGCADRDILGHLRGPGRHVRGCWVVDLLLGKE